MHNTYIHLFKKFYFILILKLLRPFDLFFLISIALHSLLLLLLFYTKCSILFIWFDIIFNLIFKFLFYSIKTIKFYF